MRHIGQFLADDAGATAFEYGLILGIGAAVVFTGIFLFYTNLDTVFRGWGSWFASPTSE